MTSFLVTSYPSGHLVLRFLLLPVVVVVSPQSVLQDSESSALENLLILIWFLVRLELPQTSLVVVVVVMVEVHLAECYLCCFQLMVTQVVTKNQVLLELLVQKGDPLLVEVVVVVVLAAVEVPVLYVSS